MIFETHAHYDDARFEPDRDALLRSFSEHDIGIVVNAASDLDSVNKTLELTENYSFIYGAIGVHPENVEELSEESFLWLREMASRAKIVAIGEIGLDYHFDGPNHSLQMKWLERQLRLSNELHLPVIIHSRDAAADTYRIIRDTHNHSEGGVIHCFSYPLEMAERFVELGYAIGIGGVVTFKNAKKLKEVVAHIPIERIVLETDCPYMAPEPHRGSRNSSLNLVYVAREIAKLKGFDYDYVVSQTEKNAKRLYRIP